MAESTFTKRVLMTTQHEIEQIEEAISNLRAQLEALCQEHGVAWPKSEER